jgi:4-hydroxyphenylpyruvate dioxygenase
MEIIGQSMHETGNHVYHSYVLQTGAIKWVVTSPYLSDFKHPKQECPHPNFKAEAVRDWVSKHGNGVAVIGIVVEDAKKAFELSTGVGLEGDGWATGVTPPTELKDDSHAGSVVLSEIIVYGETVLRFLQYKDGFNGPFLPGYKEFKDTRPLNYGIRRMDHVVGNAYDMTETINRIKKWLGLRTFAKFSKEDIQTEYTSLNSEVLANDFDTVLMPINEPAKKKMESQITEYLKANNGPGVQHIALFSNDVLETIDMMRQVSLLGGFEFIPTPVEYYNDPVVKRLMGEHLTEAAQKTAIEFGLLVDEDDEGILLQIFTKPLFDRPTLFVEIIQRICHGEVVDKPGCGGFGKGNFRALFQSIERMQAQRDMLLPEQQ